MVRIDTQVGEKQFFTARMMACAVWFDRYEYRINCREGFGVVKLEDPPLFAGVVFVEDPPE